MQFKLYKHMGFFDSLFKQAPPVQKPTFANNCDAIVAILYSAINSDGNIDSDEIEALARIVVLKRSFQGYNTAVYYKNAIDLTKAYGGAYVIKAAADMLSEEDRKLSFVFALELLMANGKLEQDEIVFVNDLASVLQLDQSWSDNVSEIMMLKYN